MPQLSLRNAKVLGALAAVISLLLVRLRKRRERLSARSVAISLASCPQVTSSLTQHRPRSKWYEKEQTWGSFCPCCRRPIEISCESSKKPAGGLGFLSSRPREAFAYVSLIYGEKPRSARYALGALGLGQALHDTGSTIDRVLMHTSDVPAVVLDALRSSGLWILHEVEYMHGCDKLGSMSAFGWQGIFTKLRLFGLSAYTKVLFLDLDILPLSSLDSLFELEAPAAMLKATGYFWQPEHGERLDGRRFFPTQSWNSPHGGINAGVMLFEPDKAIESLMEREVTDEQHPEHIYATGPEQEYLSRFFADKWRHIHSRFNFQLFRLDPTEPLMKFDAPRLGDAVLQELIAVQFSSHPKPWDFADSVVVGTVDQDICKSLSSKWHGDGRGDAESEARASLLNAEMQQPERWPLQARVAHTLIKGFLQTLAAAEARVNFGALQDLHTLCAQAPDSTLARSRPRNTSQGKQEEPYRTHTRK